MLIIFQLNCRGYYTNRHLIAEEINTHNPDIILLNHTGTPPPSHPIKHFGYTTRFTRDTFHDGVAILIKSHLRHTFLTSWIFPHFLAVKLHTQTRNNHSHYIRETTHTHTIRRHKHSLQQHKLTRLPYSRSECTTSLLPTQHKQCTRQPTTPSHYTKTSPLPRPLFSYLLHH